MKIREIEIRGELQVMALFLRSTFIFLISFTMTNFQLVVSKQELGVHFNNSLAADPDQATSSSSNQGKLSLSVDDEEVSDNYISSFILMLVVGLVFKNMFVACEKKTADMWVALAAGALYLIGEIVSFGDYQKITNKKLGGLENINDYVASIDLKKELAKAPDVQLQALKTERELWVEFRDVAKRKHEIVGYAEIGFKTAFWTAMASSSIMTVLLTACKGCPIQVILVEGLLKSLLWPSPSSLNSTAMEGYSTSIKVTNPSCVPPAAAPGSSYACTGASSFITGFLGVCTLKSIDKKIDKMETIDLNANPTLVESSFLDKVFSLIFPKAKAVTKGDIWKSLGLVGTLAGVVMGLKELTWVGFDSYISSPFLRMILWKAILYLIGKVQDGAKKQLTFAEGNIEKIDVVLDKFKVMNRFKDVRTGGGSFSSPNSSKIEVLPFIINKRKKARLEGEKDCPAVTASGKCISITKKIKEIGIPKDFGKPLANGIINFSTLSDQLTGATPFTASKSLTANLGKNLNAIRDQGEQNKRKIDEILKKSGRPPLDIKGEAEKLLAKLSGNLKKSLKKKGFTPKSFLREIGRSSSGEGAKNKEGKKIIEKAPPSSLKLKKKRGVRSGTTASIPTFNFNESQAQEASIEEKFAKNEAAISKLKSESKDDITKNKDISLFRIITGRYFRSGYPRLLEEDSGR